MNIRHTRVAIVVAAVSLFAGLLPALAGLGVAPASAMGSYSNANIANVALQYVGHYGGAAGVAAGRSGYTGGAPLGSGNNNDGECRAFVNEVVWIASNHTQWVGGGGSDYFAVLAANGTQITDINALQEGDVVQIGSGVHTFIIVSRVSGSTFNVVDSNYNYDHIVRSHQMSVALSSTERAYQLGSTAPPALPAQPANPRVTSVSSSTATLAWNDVSNNETSFATQYRIGNSGGFTPGPSAGANSQSITIGGLHAGTAYTFQVGARNSAGQTHWSAYAYGTTSRTTSAPALNYQVTNYDNDGTTGVYLRNSANINDVNRDSAHFVGYGTTVTLLCGGFGSAVGPYGNTAWDYVRVSDGRTGWISEHWLNTPVSSNQHVAGEPSC